MKKILGISLVAVLAATPLMAGADPVSSGLTPTAADPVATTNVATDAPQYALAEANDNDGNFATAGYVKGAYNAAIKAVNKTAEVAAADATTKANTAEQNAKDYAAGLASNYADTTLSNVAAGSVTTAKIADENVTLGKLSAEVQASLALADSALQSAAIADKATKTGVENTIKATTASGNVTFGTISTTGTVNVPTTAAYNVMATWGSDTPTSGTLSLGDAEAANISAGTTIGTSSVTTTVNENTVSYATANPS